MKKKAKKRPYKEWTLEEMAAYEGKYLGKQPTREERLKNWTHPIPLYDPGPKESWTNETTMTMFENWTFYDVHHVVNVYEHTLEDFEFNSFEMFKYFKRMLKDPYTTWAATTQRIMFRVVKDGQIFNLSLFKFIINYIFLQMPIEVGADMTHWHPIDAHDIQGSTIMNAYNREIERCQSRMNIRKCGELIETISWLLKQFVSEGGLSRIGIEFNMLDFIEVMKRSKEAWEIITCQWDADSLDIADLERVAADKTRWLMDFIASQSDLSLSVYARNGIMNIGQFRELACHILTKPSLDGKTLPLISHTNLMMGLNDPISHAVDAYGGRKAEAIKLKVSEANVMERSMTFTASPIRAVDLDYECDSRHFRKKKIESVTDLYNLDGRVFTMDKDSDEFEVIIPGDMTDLIGETIYLKTPITCTHPLRKMGVICQACYGLKMATINCDVSIGKLGGFQAGYMFEQKDLQAKHILQTSTIPVEFNDNFDQYFVQIGNGIAFNYDVLSESTESRVLDHIFFEFSVSEMRKLKDGESRHYDRAFREIVIYNELNDDSAIVYETNGADIFLSPEFNNRYFLPKLRHHSSKSKDPIRIPFSSIVSDGESEIDILFEFQRLNNEITAPLDLLHSTLRNDKMMSAFQSYDECVDTLIPLFRKAGISIPDYLPELILANMIISDSGEMVDWTEEHPSYHLTSMVKSIDQNPSAIQSMLFHEPGKQLEGAYNTYGKTGVGDYDYFLANCNNWQ